MPPYPASGSPPPSLRALVERPIKKAIAGGVVALFNDRATGETPVR